MRKIRKWIHLDPATFDVKIDVKIKDGDIITALISEPFINADGYDLERQSLIEKYNRILIDKNMPVLTKDESDYALGLHNSQRSRDEETTPADLQILAGCKVEPIIAKARNEMEILTGPIKDLLINYFKECSDTEANLARSELAGIIYRLQEQTREDNQGNNE